jgi:hypothetical protein
MGFFENRKEILKVRVQLASERKWMFLSVAAVALAILCNSAFSMILTAISLFLTGVATVFKACCFVVSGIIDIISKGINKIRDMILN